MIRMMQNVVIMNMSDKLGLVTPAASVIPYRNVRVTNEKCAQRDANTARWL